MRRRQRRMRGNLPGPEGLARRGASAALHGLPVVTTTGGAARLASAPSPCQRGSRGILRQAPRIDWSQIDTVLLDMDGTLLDLRFDNWFWQELIPRRYAAAKGLSEEETRGLLAPKFIEV